MADELKPGIYEALVTEALEATLQRAREIGWAIESAPVDEASIAQVLARHIHDQVRDRINSFPASTVDRRRAQVDLANRVLEVLAPYTTDRERARRDPARALKC